jgi:hypothetical protein
LGFARNRGLEQRNAHSWLPAHSFTGISGGGSRLRCLSFAKNTSATSGLRARVLGVYCTALANPLNETIAADLLQRIQVQ